MTKKQEYTFNMYKNIKDCLAANSNITIMLPQYAMYYALFDTSFNQIAMMQAKQLQNNTIIQTANKAFLRQKCIKNIMNLLISLNTFALITKNVSLKQATKLPLSTYKHATGVNFVALCNNLYNTAFLYAAQLTNYGINANFFIDFRQNIDDFATIMTAPRQSIIQSSANTSNLVILFNKKFADLYTLVAFVKFDAPIFYNNFIASSKIINKGIKPLAFRAALTDQHGIPLSSFKFIFTRLSDNKKMEYKTNNNGTIIRKVLKADAYNLTISKLDYTSLTLNIVLQENLTYNINFIASTNDNTISIKLL